jgi:acyl-CoA thioester hydrolase
MSALPFSLDMPVRWRDMDALAHVNNASYLGYVEEARVGWFQSLSSDWSGAPSSPVMAAVTMNYRKPARWPESLRVELFAERVGSKSLTLGHRIVSTTEAGVVYADGSTVLVWVEASGASVPLPVQIRRACGQP